MKRILAAVLAGYLVTLAVLMHHDSAHRDLWVFGVSSVFFAVSVALLARLRPTGRAAALLVLGVGALLQLVALTRAPLTSDDANRYVWDGTVQLAGIDPYRYAPQDPHLTQLRDATLFGPTSACTHPIPGGCTAINRPGVHTIYPPVAQAAFDVGRIVSFGGHGGVFVFQVFGALGSVVIGWLLARRALARGRALWPVALWSWCPLVVSEFGNNGHLDWLGVLFTVLALGAGARGRHGRAGVLAGLAIATKLYPGLVLPALMRRRPWFVAGAALATVALTYLPHVLVAAKDVFGYLPGYLNEEGYDSGSRFVLLGLVLPHPADTVAAVLLVAAGAWFAWRRSDPDAPEQAATLLTGVTFLVVTPDFGWYAALLLCLAVLSRRYEWVVLAMAPSFAYLIHSDTRNPAAASISYAIGAAGTFACWWWRTHRARRQPAGHPSASSAAIAS